MKTIALFGATGKTGVEVLKKALNKGYKVQALVRNPTKLSKTHKNLHTIKGDVLNPADVEQCVNGVDGVISVFGHVKGSPEFLQTQGTEHIVKAMEKYGVSEIISLSGGGLPFPEKDEPKFPDKLIRTIMKLFVPKVLNDAIAHADVLKKSKTRWMIVRGPRLTQEQEKGSYRVGWVGVNASTKIGRVDLADFIVKQIEEFNYPFQMPFVTY